MTVVIIEKDVRNYSGIGIAPDFSLVIRQEQPLLFPPPSALADGGGKEEDVQFPFHQTKVWCCPN